MRKLLPLLAAIACAFSAFGQAPSDSPSPAPSSGPHDRFTRITPQMRDTLTAAAARAQGDPKVQATVQAWRDASKAAQNAMVEKDPSIAPLVAKLQSGAPRASLTPAERVQLRGGVQSIRGTPAADALQQATFAYREALRQSIEASDPSLAPTLEKMALGSAGMGRWFGGPDGANMSRPAATPSASSLQL